MSIFQPKGDIHGRHCIGSPSVRGHYRPFDYDSGADFVKRDVRVDDVEPNVGEGIDTGDIRDFCLCSSQSERKD